MRSLLGHLLRVVSWPHWVDHWFRTALTVVGVSLGVATIVAVADITDSVLESFEHMVETVAGASALEVTSSGGPIDEALIGTAATTPGVKEAAGLVEAFVGLTDLPAETLYVLGIDFLGSSVWRAQMPRDAIDIPDELAFISQLDSVMLGRAFATRAGVREGAEVRVISPGGTRVLRVRGMLGDVAPARLFDGAIAVMDLPAAQRLLGREGHVDRIAIELEPGVATEPVRQRLAERVGPGVEVGVPEARGAQAEKLLFSLQSILVVAGSLAVIVGAFIVYHAVVLSVQQRRRQFALLNAVGIERSTLVRLCLVETAGLAVVGVLLGILGGRMLASFASGIVGSATSEIWLRVPIDRAAHSVSGMVTAAVVGLTMALAAAYLAVRSTFAAPTVEALRPVAVETESRSTSSVGAVVVGLLLVAATWLVVLADPRRRWMVVAIVIASQLVAYCGGALLAPPLVSAIGAMLRRAVGHWQSLPVRLAVDNFSRSPRRAGITVATITAAFGMAVCMVGLVQSFEGAWTGWIEQHFAADVFVGSGTRFRLLAGPAISLEVRELLAGIPGVASVEPFRVLPTRLEDQPVFLQGVSVADRLAHGGLPMVEGDLAQAAPALLDGTGVLLSDNLAFRLGLHRGNRVTLSTPGGPRTFRVEGTFVDYLGSLDLGAVAVADGQLATLWNDHSATLFRLWLEPGASVSAVRSAALGRLGPGYYAITSRQFLDAVQSVLRRFFVASWVLVLVAPLVGVIGVVNSQLATVVDRWTEIAMLRTIGVSRQDLSRSVLLECGALGAFGALFGLGLGAMLFAQFIGVSMRLLTGWRIPFALPLGPLVAGVLCTALISAAAGYVPARVAARLEARQQSPD
jgi:putative ABC transport system permease protein